MILADTSIWVDHLRTGDARLAALLETGMILTHPFVVGELALGNLRQRSTVLTLLQVLPHALTARDEEARAFIERHGLAGRGIGYIDAHLLAATRLSAGAALWTRDRRLASLAHELDIGAPD